jgi:hypothetical protein
MIYVLNASEVPEMRKPPEHILTESGVCRGHIRLAREVVASTGAQGIRLYFETENGKVAVLSLYTKSKNGRLTKAYNLIQGIMIVLGEKRLLPKTMKVKEYDAKRRVELEVVRTCFPALHGREIIFEIVVGKDYTNKRYPMYMHNLVGVFHPETGQSPDEILNNLPSVKVMPK